MAGRWCSAMCADSGSACVSAENRNGSDNDTSATIKICLVLPPAVYIYIYIYIEHEMAAKDYDEVRIYNYIHFLLVYCP